MVIIRGDKKKTTKFNLKVTLERIKKRVCDRFIIPITTSYPTTVHLLGGSKYSSQMLNPT